MTKLLSLKPEYAFSHGCLFWFTPEGELLYGKTPDNLVYPDWLVTTGRLHIYLADLKAAFRLGRESALETMAQLLSRNLEGTPVEIANLLWEAGFEVTVAQVALWRSGARRLTL